MHFTNKIACIHCGFTSTTDAVVQSKDTVGAQLGSAFMDDVQLGRADEMDKLLRSVFPTISNPSFYSYGCVVKYCLGNNKCLSVRGYGSDSFVRSSHATPPLENILGDLKIF